MPAIDTVALYATEGAAAAFPTSLAAANGDSLTVRNYAAGQSAFLTDLIYSAGGSEQVRIKSPNLHDNQTGLTFEPANTPSRFLIPPGVSVGLQANDTLTVDGGIAAAGTIVAGLQIYYTQLPAIAQRLHMWGDIKGNIKYIKSVEVDLDAIAVGAWTDTLITTTENQLHSNADYAILGYQMSEAVDLIGVKGSATGNLRICGPGATATNDLTNYFVNMSEQLQMPFIPVFNSDDRTAFYVSAFNNSAIAKAAASAYLIMAELTSPVTP